ncbi:taste receptor type 1 member 1-like [Anarrhichthys ocellatus]|uniref:taste receptor type 1 member 1-like n=1 Tax=Anarrhichthys ocellatus TaxID=433405 RepID=UPI0012EECDAA|nr:taste receptor type 1 member 1-like [Anarrhichthys ocellatus]
MFDIRLVNGRLTSTMKHLFVSLLLLGAFLRALAQCTVPASEFQLEGDYLLAGLFDIHHDNYTVKQDRPEAIDCSSQPFILSSYRRFQLMRFSVEEINNSTKLLPNVSLGYEIFDHCSDIHNFPGIFKLLSVDGLIQPWGDPYKNLSKVMGVVGTYTSTQALTVAPLFMMDLIPMVLAELKKSNFTLLNQSVTFDENGDPNFGSYSIVFWNQSGDAEEIGICHFHPKFNFFINDTKIQWYTKGKVPTSLCSQECDEGFVQKHDGIHQCCFDCEICPKETYINKTGKLFYMRGRKQVQAVLSF